MHINVFQFVFIFHDCISQALADMDQIKQDKDAAEEMFANSIAILNAAAETKDKELQDMLTTHQQLQDEVNSLKEQGIRDASRYAAQDNSIKELEQVVGK